MISKVLYVLLSDTDTVVSVRDHGDQSVAVSGKTIYEVLEALGQQFEDFWIYFSNEMDAHSIPFD
ncbi:MAG: hypothetical protein ACI86L_002127, partial [Dokdonia sp.]